MPGVRTPTTRPASVEWSCCECAGTALTPPARPRRNPGQLRRPLSSCNQLLGVWGDGKEVLLRIEATPDGMSLTQWFLDGSFVTGGVDEARGGTFVGLNETMVTPRGFDAEWVVAPLLGFAPGDVAGRRRGSLWLQLRSAHELRTAFRDEYNSVIRDSLQRLQDISELPLSLVESGLWVCPPGAPLPQTPLGWLGPVTASLAEGQGRHANGITAVVMTDAAAAAPPPTAGLASVVLSGSAQQPPTSADIGKAIEFLSCHRGRRAQVAVCGRWSVEVAAACHWHSGECPSDAADSVLRSVVGSSLQYRCSTGAPEPEAAAVVEVMTRWRGAVRHGPASRSSNSSPPTPKSAKPQRPTSRRPCRRPEPVLICRGDPKWESDDTACACEACGSEFGLTNRRHHCRHCGRIFCSIHSSKRAMLKHRTLAQEEMVRVCVSCHDKLRDAGCAVSSVDVPFLFSCWPKGAAATARRSSSSSRLDGTAPQSSALLRERPRPAHAAVAARSPRSVASSSPPSIVSSPRSIVSSGRRRSLSRTPTPTPRTPTRRSPLLCAP